MFGLPILFAAPLVLIALAGLPVLYYLLRVTPPPPQRVPLPTLPLVKDLVAAERQPSRTPWWLLALRLMLAAAAILALAGPQWNPKAGMAGQGTGPLVLLIDNGWASAPDWARRRDRAIAILEAASSRGVAVRATAEDPQEILPGPARAAIDKVRALQPAPHTPERSRQIEAVRAYLAATPAAEAVWITDMTAVGQSERAVADLVKEAGKRLRVVAGAGGEVRGILSVSNERDALLVRLARPLQGPDGSIGLVRALDGRGRLVGEAPFDFKGRETTEARITAPLEVRNEVARVEIAEGRSAGTVHLLDAGAQRRRVAIISGETTDTAQPLVSGVYFVSRALSPYASVQEAARGADPLQRALEDRPEVVVLVDVGTVSGQTFEKLNSFVQEGGVLIRFAGSGLAASSDALLPVKLRRGGRILGGTLSWEKPQTLAAFPEGSPFAGLAVPADIAIERQVLAEPEPALTERTWAALADGTPLVTAARRGKGLVVLFHVTADTSWSSLPLSGLFVDMLRRMVTFAATSGNRAETGTDLINPRRVLDGYGSFSSPPPTARPMARGRGGVASAEHPPGFYGPGEATVALNTLAADTALTPLDVVGANAEPLEERPPVDLRAPLLITVFALALLDILAVLFLAGLLSRRALPRAAALLLAAGLLAGAGDDVLAQAAPTATPRPLPQASKEDMDASYQMRLAYVITGNSEIDETSKLGLTGLTRALATRTAFEPGPPVGIDPGKDELVFYAVIYWPISADQPLPGEAALKKIDQFMKNGGTVIFDTRDALSFRTGSGAPSAETRRLRQMLSSLDLPELEPVPRDHVVTKTFYLLDKIIGRYAQGETWIEALPRGGGPEKRPARAGDRVSPVIITANDLAAAWASDRNGNPRFPMVPGEPRQREMALRTGINLMMYAMTGNYKADQVHIPALLERLGQ